MSCYPEGYRDPEYNGSLEEFRDKVIPARCEAISRVLSDLLPDGWLFAWE